MEPEERDRLVRLETKFEEMSKWMIGIDKKVDEIRAATHMGKGAWAFIIRAGGFLLVMGTAISWVWDHVIALLPHAK